jgi:HicB-like protein involved in pilus formation
MDITRQVESLRTELANAAELGGAEARALAERLTAPMESAFRLALLDALSAAADEITRDLAPGSVQLRLNGREPSFVVTPPPADDEAAATPPPVVPIDSDDAAVARINLRLSDPLKARIEEAAARDGLSVNAWLVRAATAAVAPAAPTTARAPRGGQRFTGWVR